MSAGTVAVVAAISLAVLGVAMLLALVRVIAGPSVPDRVVALDLLALLTVGFIGVYAIATEQPELLDAGLVLALLAFLATVTFARYFGRKGLS